MSKKITLKSSDGQTFEVEEMVASESQMLKRMIDDGVAGDVIPLGNVTGNILAKVIQYCDKHAKARSTNGDAPAVVVDEEDLNRWDKNFLDVDQATLFALMMAANYLDIASLLSLTCQTVADMMRGRSVPEIRRMFNIQNDFTPEEEAQMREAFPFF